MRRWLSVILVCTLLLGSMVGLEGCSGEQIEILTKGQWLEMLAGELQLTECENQEPIFSDIKKDSTYFIPAQACAEWDIVDKGGEFEPDSEATIDFAISTAIRAIGVDKIAKSTYKKTLQTDEERIDFFREISDKDYLLGGALYREWGDNVLSDMNTILSSLQLEQYQDIGLTENSMEVSAEDVEFSLDGQTGQIVGENIALKPGIVLVVMPSQLYPDGMAVKITEVNGKKFTYVNASMEEALDHVVVTGTYEPKVLGVLPMSDDVKVESINGEGVVPQSYRETPGGVERLMYVTKTKPSAKKLASEHTIGLKDITFSVLDKSGKVGDAEGSIGATVGIKDISVTADVEVRGLSVKRAYTRIDSALNAHVKASGNVSKTIPLAKVPCQICAGVTVEFQANLVAGANGELNIDWSLPTSVGVEYKKGAKPKFIQKQSKPNLTIDANAEVYALPGLKGIFKAIGFSIASAGIDSGIKLEMNGTGETKGKTYCLDLQGYVPLSCFVGGEGGETLLGKIGIKKSWNIWDKNSSPIQKKLHIENRKIVPECTHPEEEEAEPIEFDDYKLPEFPKMDFSEFKVFESGYLGIQNSFYSMKLNTCQKFKPGSLPNGYTPSDLVYSSKDESIVSVGAGGELTASGVGTVILKIETKDGKYSQFITVTVSSDDDTVEYTPVKPVTPMSFGQRYSQVHYKEAVA